MKSDLLISTQSVSISSKALAIVIHISMLITSSEISNYLIRFYNGHYGLFDNLNIF